MVCLLKPSISQVKTIDAKSGLGKVQDYLYKDTLKIDVTSAFSFDEFCHHCVDTVTAIFVCQNGNADSLK